MNYVLLNENKLFLFSYILYCMRYIGNRLQSDKVIDPFCMRYIGNRCPSDKVVDLFNSKGELMEEGRMSCIDNNLVKITVLIFFFLSLLY